MKKDLILVVGATGTIGSGVVEMLKSEGFEVRTTTSKASRHPEEFSINLLTGEGVNKAFEGVDRAFLLSPPGYADQHQMLSPLIQESKRRGLKKVVLMTALGANANESSPFRRAEIELEKSGLNYNIVRPNWFYQNFNTFWVQGIQEQRKILLPAGQAKVSFIDARDISAVIAKLLVDDSLNNKDFDLTGPESVTHDEVAKSISKAIGERVKYEEISPETLKQVLLSVGLPEDYVDFMLLIFGYLREGYNANTNDHVKLILGREPNGLENYVNDFKKAWG